MKYRVNIRRDLAEVRPCAEQIDGKVFNFVVGWTMDGADTTIYIGEVAMIPHDDDYPTDGPNWVASGDLESVKSSEYFNMRGFGA